MTKLYYDDTLQAAWMVREFKVKTQYYDKDIQEYKDESFNAVWENIRDYNEKFYIHPDSLHVFKPHVGDMILFRGEYGALVYADDLMKIPAENHEHCDPCFTFHNDVWSRYIIKRDDKAFFMPKEELT